MNIFLKHIKFRFFLLPAIFAALFLLSCSPTKYLEKEQHLLTETEIKIIPHSDTATYDFDDYDLHYLIRPEPNSKVLFIRLNARIYNLRNPESVNRAIKKYKRKRKRLLKKEEQLEKKLNKINRKRKYDRKLKRFKKVEAKIEVLKSWLNTKPDRSEDLVISHEQNYRKTYRCLFKKDYRSDMYELRIRELKQKRDKHKKGSEVYKQANKKLKSIQLKRNETEAKNCNKLHWTRKAGEKPVLYKKNDEFRNTRQMRIFLKNKGYYNAKIKPDAKPDGKKKMKMVYKIYPNRPYRIRSFVSSSKDSAFKSENNKIINATLLRKGNLLDIKLLEKERQRIYQSLRNKGYYKFSKDYIYFRIDTLNGNHTADIRMQIKMPYEDGNPVPHRQYKIRTVRVFPAYDPKKALNNITKYHSGMDTLLHTGDNGSEIYFLSDVNSGINPKVIAKGTYVLPDSLYKNSDVKATYRYLASMKIIKIANIDFAEADTLDGKYGLLDCNLKLTQNSKQAYTTELEATNTSGDIGAAGNIIYSHKNVFKNAETFDLKLKGALERKADVSGESTTTADGTKVAFFNSYEIGADMSLELPRLFIPGDLMQFIKRNNPKTSLNANLNLLSRPDYNRQVAGLSFGYFWNSSPKIKHTFKPVLFDLVRLRNPSNDFLAYINKYKLYESYEDHLIFGSSYSISFSDSYGSNDKHQIFTRINGKLAGNSLYAAMKISGAEKDGNSYTITGNSFAQFSKLDVDFRYYRKLYGSEDMLVIRTFIGLVYPYGNLSSVPFGEKFFTGGANGIRAWQVRTLGPGSYILPDDIDVFPNQTADLKMEFNLEYRMKLFWMVEGALFLDAGNIWAVNDSDDREGAQFYINNFHNEIAVGSGIGFRLDFDFFIIRFDVGLKLRDPAAQYGKRWIHLHRKMQRRDWAFNIGIGYPF